MKTSTSSDAIAFKSTPKHSCKMTSIPSASDDASQAGYPAFPSPAQSPRRTPPKWEIPKAHHKAQKQRIGTALKVAKEAKADAKAQSGRKIQQIAQTQTKVSVEAQQYFYEWIPAGELCRSCGIYAAHGVGIYRYASPEVPKKIIHIQAMILKGTATRRISSCRMRSPLSIRTTLTYKHSLPPNPQPLPPTRLCQCPTQAAGSSDRKGERRRVTDGVAALGAPLERRTAEAVTGPQQLHPQGHQEHHGYDSPGCCNSGRSGAVR